MTEAVVPRIIRVKVRRNHRMTEMWKNDRIFMVSVE